MDLKLTADGDLDMTNGRLHWVVGIDAVVQKVTMRLRTFLGESVYDRLGGVPWRQVLFERGITEAQATSILGGIIRAIPGVDELRELDVSIDRITRVMTVTGTIVSDGEAAPVNANVAAP